MFLTSINAMDDRSPWGDFWFEPVAMRSLSGVRVSADTAMQLSAVFRAVQLISGHFAILPLIIKNEGSLKTLKTHWLYDLFKRPNQWQNGFEWRQMLMAHLLLRGNAYCEIIDNARGEITALLPLHPDMVKIEQLPSGDYRYRVTDGNGQQRPLQRGQVWHLRGLSSNGITGLSVIECARESMGLGLSAQAYGARFFANDARPGGGWIEVPGNFADKNAREVFRESVQAAQAASNRGKIMVLDRGMQYHDVALTNQDAQFLETRKFQLNEIARWFGIPPHKLGDLDRSTNNNIEQQALEYISDCLLYWTELWEAAIEGELLLKQDNVELEFDVRRLERGDSAARANFNQKGIFSGYITRNEARADEGREPIEGLDEPLQPLNMAELSDTPASKQPAAKRAPAQPSDNEAAARLAVIIAANASRLARRIANGGAADAEMIAGSLGVPLAAANEWVASLVAGQTVEALTVSLMELGEIK